MTNNLKQREREKQKEEQQNNEIQKTLITKDINLNKFSLVLSKKVGLFEYTNNWDKI